MKQLSLLITREDADVLESTRSAIESLHAMLVPYADIMAPLHDGGLQDAMRKLTIRPRGESLGTQDVEAVSPPVFGRYILLYSTDIDDRRRGFAIRHGMGHVAAGHVSEIAYMKNRADRDDFMSHEERVADLFALGDLISCFRLDELRKQRMSWRALTQEICRVVRQHTLEWPEQRVHDRAVLRVLFYRAYQM